MIIDYQKIHDHLIDIPHSPVRQSSRDREEYKSSQITNRSNQCQFIVIRAVNIKLLKMIENDKNRSHKTEIQ